MIKLSNVQSIIAVIGFLFVIGFWFYTIYGLPKRVDNHESRITTLEHENVTLKTKQDMILSAVYEIRSVLLKK